METYITKINNQNIRKTISKFRLSDQKLKIEVQIYVRPKLSPDQRIFTTCGETEDELRCIVRCKLKKKLKEKTLLPEYRYITKVLATSRKLQKFIILQQSDQICDQNMNQFESVHRKKLFKHETTKSL